jgi:hypothetical protein
MNSENVRLQEARDGKTPWKKWGPYLSERQWGTVREDYSESGDAWSYFAHDQARSRAYRWREDGLAGISDDKQQRVCTRALERRVLRGGTRARCLRQSGEDVKEYYFYLDSTPTHSYMKYLYKYPQRAYPYDDLVRTNAKRGRQGMEYELLDTGVFDDDRYFDVFVEYAKASAEDILIQVTAHNRGLQAATLHVLPTIWFRNTWSQGKDGARPILRQVAASDKGGVIAATHATLGERFFYSEGAAALLFTENETNTERLGRAPNRTPYVKDGIDNYVVHGQKSAVNPEKKGRKPRPIICSTCPPENRGPFTCASVTQRLFNR